MIVGDLNVKSMAALPSKTDPVLIVDADAVLSSPVTLQGFEPVRQAWLERAMGMGQACRARLPRQTLDGVAESLDADGALLLRLPSGDLTRIAAGDVFFGAR